MDTHGEPSSADRTSQVVAGGLILALGLLLLADRYVDRDVPLARSWWPILLLVLGAMRIAGTGDRRSRRGSRWSGVWLVMVGCWGVVSEARLFGFTYGTSWPLLVTGVGVLLVWRALSSYGAGEPGRPGDPGGGPLGAARVRKNEHRRSSNVAGRRHWGCRAGRFRRGAHDGFPGPASDGSMRAEP